MVDFLFTCLSNGFQRDGSEGDESAVPPTSPTSCLSLRNTIVIRPCDLRIWLFTLARDVEKKKQ